MEWSDMAARRIVGALSLVVAVVFSSTPPLVSSTQASTPGTAESAQDELTADDLFDSQVLQRIDLTINSRDWEKLKANFLENTYYPLSVSWRGQVMRNAWVRSRGAGSRSEGKPGLKLEFNRNASGPQTWLGLKSLVLRNLTQDPSGMHEILAFKLFERMGFPASHEALAEVYINRSYAGLYLLVENIEAPYLARVFGEEDGFLFDYKWHFPYGFTYLGPELESYQQLFEAKTHKHDAISTIYDPIHSMVREINQARDDLFQTNVSAYLDLPMFMRYIAVENVLAEWDGVVGYAGLNNFFLYRPVNSTLSQFLPWDADNTFHAIDFPILSEHDQNVLMRRAMTMPNLRSEYFNSLLSAVASMEDYSEDDAKADADRGIAPRGWLQREVDRLYALIRTSMRKDVLKAFSDDEFEDSVVFMKQFSRERGPFVRCEVTKITAPSNAANVCGPAGP